MKRSIKYFWIFFIILLSSNSFSINNVSYCIKSPSYVFAGETYSVSVTINKKYITGSSKFEVTVPKGFIIEPINTSGANFIFNDNKGKFIWVIIPSTESFSLSYNITIPHSYNGEKKIFRKFFYVKDNKVHEEEFYSIINIIENDLLTQIVPEISQKNNIIYKIQIGAFSNKVSVQKFSQNITNNYNLEELFTENYFKYFVGNYTSINDALSVKNSLGINGAFITAYNNNERITIKEAIKKQKGY